MSAVQPDLFEWAASLPPSKVIDLKQRREVMRRWPDRVAGIDRAIARKQGKLPPARIIAFPVIHPAAHLAYVDGPSRAQR